MESHARDAVPLQGGNACGILKYPMNEAISTCGKLIRLHVPAPLREIYGASANRVIF
jgi:hypothetical protein